MAYIGAVDTRHIWMTPEQIGSEMERVRVVQCFNEDLDKYVDVGFLLKPGDQHRCGRCGEVVYWRQEDSTLRNWGPARYMLLTRAEGE